MGDDLYLVELTESNPEPSIEKDRRCSQRKVHISSMGGASKNREENNQ